MGVSGSSVEGSVGVSGSGSGSKGELSRSEVVLLLLLSEGSKRKLVLCQSPSESSGLLVSQVIGSSLLLGVSASLVSSLLVDHSKHLSDGLSHELRTRSLEEEAVLTLMRASLTWGAADTLLTLS